MAEHPKQLSPLTLAFLGDGVYEVMVRQYLIGRYGSMPPGRLHKLCVQYVRAPGQYRAVEHIYEKLSEEEQQIFKRGRNASGITAPKNVSVTQYRAATGLEALWGYLYLCGQQDRLETLFCEIITLALECEGQTVT